MNVRPFFTTKPPGEGTGLSLSVSLDIIQIVDGRIEVESKLATKATFKVILLGKPIHQTDV